MTALLSPSYKLTFSQATPSGGAEVSSAAASVASEGKVIDTTGEPRASIVVDLKVELDMETPADTLTLMMGQVGSFRPQLGDRVKVELGYADDAGGLEHVITAELSDTGWGIANRRLVGLSSARKLLAARADEHFEDKTAGAIVEDLAGRAGVEVERTEAGSRFPAYVVDARRSLYDHIRDLADLCGLDLYITPEGKVVFEEFVGGRTVHVFEYRKHIIDIHVEERAAASRQVQAWGEGPGGGQGAQAWAWLTKDFSSQRGTAGEGEPLALLERPALRNAQAARNAAEALHTRIERDTLRGWLLLTGSPQVKLGDAIALQSLPEESLNGNYQVRAVTHRITKAAGFATCVRFRRLT
jgi:phage protein D